MITRKRSIALVSALLVLVMVLMACGDATPQGSSIVDPIMPVITTDTGWVVDPADGMSAETEAVLEEMANRFDQYPDGYQVAIAVFKNSASDDLEFATRFGDENGIGSAERDNGIAIVLFTDKEGSDGNSPSIGVAIGSGLEGDLNDAKVGRMLDKTYVPARAEGNWEKGLIEFVNALELVLTGQDGDQFAPEPINWWFWGGIILFIIILLILDFRFFDGNITFAIVSVASKSGSGGGFSGGGASR